MATVTEFAQRFFQRFARLARYVVLRRQLAEINRTLGRLELADLRAVAQHTARELDLSSRQSREASTTNHAFNRTRAGNPRVRILGIGQWLASAYRETEDSSDEGLREMHRLVCRALRLLRESGGALARAA
jgi:hypothetical protein